MRVSLVVGLIWLLGADIWLFWSENRDNVRDLLLAFAAPVAVITAGAAFTQAWIAGKRHAEQTNADRERRITDSFTKAAELLGNPEPEVRIGAIYALERIAGESKRDHWPIMETLTAYVRTKSPASSAQVKAQDASRLNQSHSSDEAVSAYAVATAEGTTEAAQASTKLATDIQAVLTVLTRRTVKHEESNQRLNLTGSNLTGAILRKTNLTGADLRKADLTGADLFGATLFGADLTGADLTGANLRQADLTGADLFRATLTGAHLFGATLTKANLYDAKLYSVNLTGVTLGNTNLENAKFCKTTMNNGTMNNRDCPPEPAPPDASETPPAPD